MQQNDLWLYLPGVAGGRAVRDRYGNDHLVAIARKGGKTTVARYGVDYMRTIASKGGKAKRTRLYTTPQTIKVWDGSIQRRVPYWPHQKSRQRRKRPVFVRIELD